MAKGNAAGHQPLSYRDRLRLNAAIKHLRSRFHSVRIAAHREIQAILHKKRGIRRLREWVAKNTRDAVRKATPRPLHRALGVKAKAAPAQARAKGAPDPLVREMPKHGLQAPGGYGQTTADLKERTKAAHRAARGQAPQSPARAPAPGQPQPARMQAPAPGRDRTAGTRKPTLQQERAAAPPPDWTRRDASAPMDWRPATPPRRDAAAKDRQPATVRTPSAPLPSEVTRTPRQPRIRLPRLRARSNS